MEFASWLNAAPGQRVALVHNVTMSLTEVRTPASFAMEPATAPCDPGQVVTDETWATSNLRPFLQQPPERLYVSLSLNIDIATSKAVIRAFQDFDCDGVIGVQELVGEFKPGVPALSGGWRLISSKLPQIDE